MSLHTTLIALGMTLIFTRTPTERELGAPPVVRVVRRMEQAASDLEAALLRRPWPAAVAEKRAKIVFAMGFFESSFHVSPPGYNDDGKACGRMQVHSPEKFVEGATCAKVRADGVLGWEAGIAVLQKFEAKCGTIVGALNAYAWDGECHPGVVMDLVRQRCIKAGLDPKTCE